MNNNQNQVFNQLQLSFAMFADCPSARNFIEAQKAMIAYQEQRNQEREDYERQCVEKVVYDYYDNEDYVCIGYPGKKVEYRCTINAVYDNPGCQGHNDLEAREGYYHVAYHPKEALEQMQEDYPKLADEGFTVEVWKVLE